jgi:two-component sensor histidine kinase
MVAEIAPIQLDIDTIIPVGLILNELITNCLKYAFPHQSNGMIKVKLYQENQMLKLSVYDNGAGLPEHFFTAQHTTFGHKMIQAFLKKWNGKMNIYSEDGTKVDIHIPLTQA